MIIPDYSSYYTFLGPNREPGPSASVEGAPMMNLDALTATDHGVYCYPGT